MPLRLRRRSSIQPTTGLYAALAAGNLTARSITGRVVGATHVLGCMLLAELHLQGQIRLSHGRIYPAIQHRPTTARWSDILGHLHSVPYAEPAAKWLDYFALGEHSTTLVWQRLTQDGAAQAERKRRRTRYVLTDPRATRWARRYLEVHGTADEPPPAPSSCGAG
jgi:hypothetical protein